MNVIKKIGFWLSFAFLFVFGFIFGKIFSDKRNRIESDTGGDAPDDEFSRNADGISKEARKSKESVFDIIERVKKRESTITNES